jgi:hypothetical protein
MANDTYPGLFSVDEDTVVEGAGCTWCGADVGRNCAQRDRKSGRAHMARWYDYWNATHERHEQHGVAVAPWRAA